MYHCSSVPAHIRILPKPFVLLCKFKLTDFQFVPSAQLTAVTPSPYPHREALHVFPWNPYPRSATVPPDKMLLTVHWLLTLLRTVLLSQVSPNFKCSPISLRGSPVINHSRRKEAYSLGGNKLWSTWIVLAFIDIITLHDELVWKRHAQRMKCTPIRNTVSARGRDFEEVVDQALPMKSLECSLNWTHIS